MRCFRSSECAEHLKCFEQAAIRMNFDTPDGADRVDVQTFLAFCTPLWNNRWKINISTAIQEDLNFREN